MQWSHPAKGTARMAAGWEQNTRSYAHQQLLPQTVCCAVLQGKCVCMLGYGGPSCSLSYLYMSILALNETTTTPIL